MEAMNKNIILAIVALAVLALAVAGYLYWKKPERPLESAADDLEQASASVPEINTNPVENEVPELNPVERVNPFKYENPLR